MVRFDCLRVASIIKYVKDKKLNRWIMFWMEFILL